MIQNDMIFKVLSSWLLNVFGYGFKICLMTDLPGVEGQNICRVEVWK